MTPQQAFELTKWIHSVFPHVTPELGEQIAESILALPEPAVRQAAAEQVRQLRWFDLPRLLKRVRELAPQSAAGETADEVRARLAAEADARRAAESRQKHDADASLAAVARLTDDQLAEVKAAALAKAPPFVRQKLRHKDPRSNVWLAALVAAQVGGGGAGGRAGA
ncbi:MAG TPA: hypothetical protein VF796_13610 [Humisphaera sp.]